MSEYFALLLDEHDRRGPFASSNEAVEVLKEVSQARHLTGDDAHHFFLYGSAVEKVETINGKVDRYRIGWLAREEAGIGEESADASSVVDAAEEFRIHEDARVEAHFTTTSRKEAEVNEGGIPDAT